MASDADIQLMHNVGLLADGVESLAKRKNEAYIQWLRIDHRRLSQEVRGNPSRYLTDQAAEKITAYEELAAMYEEALAANLAWIAAEFAKRAG